MLSSIRALVDEELLNVRTMLPGIVQSVGAGVVDVNLVIDRVLAGGKNLAVPTLQDVPILFSGSSEFGISFPVAEGDEGLILFADRDIRNFLEIGRSAKPSMQRHHDLSDGVFIPLPVSNNKRVPIEANTLLLKAGSTAAIRVKTDGTIEITGDVSINGAVTTNSTIDADGDISSATDVKAQTISLTGHVHVDSQGGTTQPPTP